ncbi:hypothetical protein F5Y15DRAFT_371275 [Xylariaceae sp. FL0016]|nr:hypothetical protein F5Y15DRAFT_371275 [Xylariaceae sp. FL0016]
MLRSHTDDRGMTYTQLPTDEESPQPLVPSIPSPTASSFLKKILLRVIAPISVLSFGFVVGVFCGMENATFGRNGIESTAPRIRLPAVERTFIYSSPFSQEPPKGPGSGNESEPIWDALIPNGLGYFQDDEIAPRVSIPTTFHQLHCLYVLRRAYYSQYLELQEFDFGKDRDRHAAHCFDYLEQSITCSVDSTVEPVDDTNEFLGSGFSRQCRSFDALKDFVEQRRVFNATGFLAVGLDHGQAHIETR